MDIFAKRLTIGGFLKLVAPATISMIFISCYTIVDGLFLGRFVGENALAAVNITMPIMNVIFAFSVMLGSGGSAFAGALLGEKKIQQSREFFSLVTVTGLIIGLILTALFLFFLEPIIYFLGSSELLFADCYAYGFVVALIAPFIMINDILEIFLRTDGKSFYSLWLAFLGGILNIFFDYVFIVEMNMGISGAAWGTALSFMAPSAISTIYFFLKKDNLYFVKPVLKWRILWDTCANGASEMVTRLSSGFVIFLFNLVTMKYLGEAGVAAISIILYAHFLMVSGYLGFSFGCAPLISYNYGAGNKIQLKKTMLYSQWVLFTSAIIIFLFAEISAPYIVSAFVGRQTDVFAIATNGLILYSLCFLFTGFNIFTSAMFTAFGNGKVSAVIALAHSFIFVSAGIMILPELFGIDGIWLTLPAAEFLTVLLSYYCFKKHKVNYGY